MRDHTKIENIFCFEPCKRTKMQFIVIFEHNHKENEQFLHYCQWTNNEVELEKLCRIVDFALYDDMDGDYCSFCCSRTLISESAVNEHLKIKEFNSYDHMFQKHIGVFECPEFDPLMDEYEVAKRLDDIFYACKLGNYFKKPTSNT